LARGRRQLDDARLECAERGYLLLPEGLSLDWQGKRGEATSRYEEALAIGERYGEQDLIAFARLGLGEVLLHQGETTRGVALLDEVMTTVIAGDLSALAGGLVYCAVIEKCYEIYDLRRAQEWTAALTRWCATQPDLVPYRAQCLVHRSQIMQIEGAWHEALEEARKACERIPTPGGRPWAGAAFYQQGELHRLRGDVAKAEEAYRQASLWGRVPQPGLALLRLSGGNVDEAVSSISRALAEARDPLSRSQILPAHVEIMLAAGDVQAASVSMDELGDIASRQDGLLLKTLACSAQGAVLLEQGYTAAALTVLRQAWSAWNILEAPYEAARIRVALGRAARLLETRIWRNSSSGPLDRPFNGWEPCRTYDALSTSSGRRGFRL
jgi:tetratricopeptide (TPR) repeat protein